MLAHATPWSALSNASVGFALVIVDHVEPFQRSTSVLPVVLVWKLPTTVQFVALAQVIPTNRLAIAMLGGGAATTDQWVPFHCSSNSRVLEKAVKLPTEKQFVALLHAMPASRVSAVHAGIGIGTTDHEEPFQCSANPFLTGFVRLSVPTASQLVALAHATPVNTAA